MKRKRFEKIIALAMAGALTVPSPWTVQAASSISYSGVKEIASAETVTGETFASDQADQSAVLVTAEGETTLEDVTVTKTGDSDGGDNCNFYGLNAAVLAKDGGTLTVKGGSITSDATGANGLFCYGGNGGQNGASGDGTTVVVEDTKITTTGSGSGGIMTTGGGVTEAKNLTIETSGGSSAPIRTDRGGGTVTVEGGTYTSNGLGSPAIYSTAVVSVSGASLVSNLSEGVCIEGQNSIALTDCDLTANNTRTNGNANFLDTIMIYQSMSGDADSGTSSFTMEGGSLTSKSGDVFHVTNTNAVITLKDVEITNEDADGALLRVSNDGWSGSENIAAVNASGQALAGEIIVSNEAVADNNESTLTLTLADGSSFTGAINTEEEYPGTVNVTIEEGCTWTLTADSYITSLSGNGTVDENGFTLTTGVASVADPSEGTSGGSSQGGAPDGQGGAPDGQGTPPDGQGGPGGEGGPSGEGGTPPEKPEDGNGPGAASGGSMEAPDGTGKPGDPGAVSGGSTEVSGTTEGTTSGASVTVSTGSAAAVTENAVTARTPAAVTSVALTTDQTVKKGLSLTAADGASYRVTDSKKKTVSFQSAPAAETLTVPDVVTINGEVYQVTEIGKNACKGNTALRSLTLGANVRKIGKGAFQGCAGLKEITVRSAALRSVGKKAFQKAASVTVTYPAEMKAKAVKKLKKALRKAGLKKASYQTA